MAHAHGVVCSIVMVVRRHRPCCRVVLWPVWPAWLVCRAPQGLCVGSYARHKLHEGQCRMSVVRDQIGAVLGPLRLWKLDILSFEDKADEKFEWCFWPLSRLRVAVSLISNGQSCVQWCYRAGCLTLPLFFRNDAKRVVSLFVTVYVTGSLPTIACRPLSRLQGLYCLAVADKGKYCLEGPSRSFDLMSLCQTVKSSKVYWQQAS